MIHVYLRTVSVSIALSSAAFVLAVPSVAQSISLLPASYEANDWAAFRGADGQGIIAARALPVEWSDSENMAWKIPLPGPGASSPIVFKDHIYWMNDNLGIAFCAKAESGDIVYEKRMERSGLCFGLACRRPSLLSHARRPHLWQSPASLSQWFPSGRCRTLQDGFA